MIDIFVFLLVLIVILRTMMYGIWTLKGKNILGGSFIMLLSSGTAVLAAYLLFRGST